MACYHCSVNTVGRNKSGAAICDYILRQGKYSRDASEVMASWEANIPGFASSASDFFSSADVHERANGRLGKKLVIALPVELCAAENEALVKAICGDIFDEKTPYICALHAGNGTNPHAHIFVSERVVTPAAAKATTAAAFFRRGVARKTTRMKSKDWLRHVRQTVAARQNEALRRAGHSARVDHRTLAAQGIHRAAQAHRGPLGHIARRYTAQAAAIEAALTRNSREFAKLKAAMPTTPTPCATDDAWAQQQQRIAELVARNTAPIAGPTIRR